LELTAGFTATVNAELKVGALEENVTVVGESATVVQTQSPSISTNLTGTQITSLPLSSRNALDSLTSLPGFNTSGAARSSTVSGLPRSAINITLDGMSVQDNYLKTTDGYFARLSPLLDWWGHGHDCGENGRRHRTGAVQIVRDKVGHPVDRTAHENFRHALNANTWFRNRDLPPDPATGRPQGKLRNYQQGVAQAGWIVKNKAFFFATT
jgi:hypothetical protein